MDDPANPSDPAGAARLAARLLLEQTVKGNRRIMVHSGELELGQTRCAVFDVAAGSVVIGFGSIHIVVIQRAGLPVEMGRYLSGFVNVTEQGLLEWQTAGTLSTFPPVLDMIRGTGARVPE